MNELKIIARINSDFPDKFGIPRQSNLVNELEATIVFEPDYRNPDALRGLENFSHIWLLWQFAGITPKTWQATVRPPRLGGNQRIGVFASRSPNRPNALGLSCVEVAGIDLEVSNGPLIHVRGADLRDNTAIYDIKPYLPFADCRPEARSGFAEQPQARLLVRLPEDLVWRVPVNKLSALAHVLALDPRPAYHTDPKRVYGLAFAGLEVKFRVEGEELTVLEVLKRPDPARDEI